MPRSEQTVRDLLTTVKAHAVTKTALSDTFDTSEVDLPLAEAIAEIADTPTIIGSPDWQAKLVAVGTYFKMCFCDAEGRLESSDLALQLVHSFLSDTMPGLPA